MKSSKRPKTNPDRRMGPDDEGSTKHPSGDNMSQRKNPEAVKKSMRPKSRPDSGDAYRNRHPSGKNIHEQDTKTYMDGGMVKNGYMDGGEVRRGDVRDNAKRGKTY